MRTLTLSILLFIMCIVGCAPSPREIQRQQEGTLYQTEITKLVVGKKIPPILGKNKVESNLKNDKYLVHWNNNGSMFLTRIYITTNKNGVIVSIWKAH